MDSAHLEFVRPFNPQTVLDFFGALSTLRSSTGRCVGCACAAWKMPAVNTFKNEVLSSPRMAYQSLHLGESEFASERFFIIVFVVDAS